MADYERRPVSQVLHRVGPATLVRRMADGTKVIREKNSTVKRRFTRVYRESTSNFKTDMDFLLGKGHNTAFSIITFDADATTPDTDTANVYWMNEVDERQLPGTTMVEYEIILEES